MRAFPFPPSALEPDYSRALFEYFWRNRPGSAPIHVISQNIFAGFVQAAIINPRDVGSMVTPTIPLAA